MVRLTNKRKLKWCLLHYEAGDTTSKWVANHLGISQRRFQQIYKQYQTTKQIRSRSVWCVLVCVVYFFSKSDALFHCSLASERFFEGVP